VAEGEEVKKELKLLDMNETTDAIQLKETDAAVVFHGTEGGVTLLMPQTRHDDPQAALASYGAMLTVALFEDDNSDLRQKLEERLKGQYDEAKRGAH
jgi:hypothetical protein